MTDKPANRMWGGRFSASPPRSCRRSTPPSASTSGWRRRISRASKAHAAMLAEKGIITQGGRARDREGPRCGRSPRSRAASFPVLARARRHPHERREPAERADRHGGRAAAHGALAQRPGGDRFPALGARGARRAATQALARLQRALVAKAEAHAATRDAGLHPPAAGPAGDLRPPSAGLCRDVRPRRGPLRRRAARG